MKKSKMNLPMILLIKEWNKAERFGQYLWNAMATSGQWESPEANALFFISNEDLIKILEKYEHI